MIESTISLRYAKALVKIGQENNQVAKYLEELEAVQEAMKADHHLMYVLTNRYADYQSRLKVVDEISKASGISDISKNFIKLLIKKARMELFPQVVRSYRDYVYELENKVEALYISATELNDQQVKDLDQLLSDYTKKTIVSSVEVDPEVLGGVAVKIGGEIFDGTVKASLDQLADQLKDARYQPGN
jgi:F-type H+-transporting ATPase subunit delta